MPKHSPILDRRLESKHWSSKIKETTVAARLPDRSLYLPIVGGADSGHFCIVGPVNHGKIVYWSGKLAQDDIILEVQGHKVSGFTLRDINDLVETLTRNTEPVLIKTIKPGLVPKDLRTYLSTSFKTGSPDHELQRTIRDNLYLRVVPCTTRPPRVDEVDLVDYRFLTVEEFIALEKSGNLLESGVYEGNHYGTPKPDSDSSGLSREALLLGLDASRNLDTFEGVPDNDSTLQRTRKRNKSTSEALSTSAHATPVPQRRPVEAQRNSGMSSISDDQQGDDPDGLGPLPSNWEMAETDEGHKYFIDHNSGTTHWEDPRLTNKQKDDADGELPYGWEKVTDPKYGIFYIDHINKRTQYEKPTQVNAAEAQARKEENNEASLRRSMATSETLHPPVFTGDIAQLKGDVLRTTLVKSPRGFGFTIIGGSDRSQPEFLQIKNVVAGGPASVDGCLSTGDVLVKVNDTLVLGYTHSDVVGLFQKIAVGQNVTLTVCKGYALPFDPADPNTRVITTVAVSLPNQTPYSHSGLTVSSTVNPRTPVTDQISSPSSSSGTKPTVASLTSMFQNQSSPSSPQNLFFLPRDQRPEFIKVNIVKSGTGFGFTIADNLQGQKVKQILDSTRCTKLREGDILVEINDRRVKELGHQEVVQTLKDCQINQEARLLIQRGGMMAVANASTSLPITSVSQPQQQNASLSSTDGGRTTGVVVSSGAAVVPTRSATPNRSVTSGDANSPSSWRYSAHMPLSVSMEMGKRELGNYAVANYLEQQKIHRSIEGAPVNGVSNSGETNTRPRARTPGPDMGRTLEEVKVPPRPKTPTALDMRGAPWQATDRTPDFLPASMFLHRQSLPNTADPGGRQGGPLQYGSLSRPGRMPPLMPRASTSDLTSRPGPGEFQVTLDRQATGFGFRILGGAEENSQASIGPLVPGGSAAQSGVVRHGDEIVTVNGQSMLGASHRSVVHILEAAGASGRVTLGLRRQPQSIMQRSTPQLQSLTPRMPQRHYPYDVTITRSETEGFGFVVISSVTRQGGSIGEFIGRLVEGSPADRCGQLRVGDRILAVNGIDICRLHHEDIVRIIKESGHRVTLRIGAPLAEETSSLPRSGRPSSVVPTSTASNSSGGEEFAVTLHRGSRGFGFSIRGGQEFNQMPLYVLRIADGGAAQVDGRLKVGDHIVSINGHNTSGMAHAQAIDIIQSGGSTIRLVVRRPSGPGMRHTPPQICYTGSRR